MLKGCMMLSEIILGVIILVILIERFLYSKEMNKQVRELAKLVKAKDTTDYVVAQKIESEEIKEEPLPEYVPLESVDDKQFFEDIKKQNA